MMEKHERNLAAAEMVRTAVVGSASAIHGMDECERRLKARPDYNVFIGSPAEFVCDCGRKFVFVEEEAEGASWELVEEAA